MLLEVLKVFLRNLNLFKLKEHPNINYTLKTFIIFVDHIIINKL